MDVKLVHPSHRMEDDEYGSDDHCTMRCTVCEYGHCYLCTGGQDDDELKAQCVGFSWYHGIYDDGGKLIGRKSGTGWPKPAKKTA